MPQSFATKRLIRFSHCDPAGIVYFVNFFDMISGCVEDWFGNALGLPFNEMHLKRRIGFPIVSTGCDFFKPCHLGEWLRLELVIARLGRSSVELRVTGLVGDEEKFRARHKIAMMSLDTQRAIAIPDDLRQKMEAFVVEPGPAA